jgi:phosphate transport system regulatory protein PhoU
MGGLAEKQIGESVDALNTHDLALAQRVIALDDKIDMLQREIEEKAILTIARRQPMAVDLRDIVGALRVANDLERIGDLAKNIAKRVGALDDDIELTKVLRGVEHMADLVLSQIKDVLDAYTRRDVEKALAVWRGDEEVDAVNNSLFRELLTYMMEDPRNISSASIFCSAPRTSNGWATMPPTSPRPSITSSKAARSPTSGRRVIPPRPPPSRFRPSAPITKFVIHRSRSEYELRNRKGTSELTFLVRLLDLKFPCEFAAM